MNGNVKEAAISPDGRLIAYIKDESTSGGRQGKQSLWVRQISGRDIPVAPPSDTSYQGLTFSLDSQFLYSAIYPQGKNIGVLYKVPVLGGTTVPVVNDIDSAVSLSPDGKRIVFIRNSSDESVVMIANEDGSGEKKLTTHKSRNSFGHVAWSPNGKVIAATSAEHPDRTNSKLQLPISHLIEISVHDGHEADIINKQMNWFLVGRPAWVRDGRGLIIDVVGLEGAQMLYVSQETGETRRITNEHEGVSLDADSRTLATIGHGGGSELWISTLTDADRAQPITSDYATEGTYSADEKKIIYVVNGNIWEMNSDGTNARQLTSEEGHSPRVTPDGRYIVFMSARLDSKNRRPHIWRMDVDGSNPAQLTSSPQDTSLSIDCTPDGKWIIYGKSLPDRGIWKVQIDGGEPVRITDKVGLSAAISPDGRMLAYEDGSFAQGRRVTITSLDGVTEKQFYIPYSQPGPGDGLRWTPDNLSLVYLKTEPETSNLWSQPISGGPPKQITDFNKVRINGFDISKGGKLLMQRYTENSEVVLIRDVQ